MRRMREMAAVTIGLATALVLTPTAGWATSDPDVSAPGPTTAAKVPAGVVGALQRDLGLSKAAAGERLAFQAGAADIEQQLASRLGADYAGAWFDTTKNVLHVGVVDAADAQTVRA